MVKITDKLDFSPHAICRGWNGDLLSKEDEKIISNLKEQYGYKGDLQQNIFNITTEYLLCIDRQRQKARPNKEKTLFEETRQAAENLKKGISFFSGSMRGKIIDSINALYKSKDCPFSQIEENLVFFIQGCNLAILQLKKPIKSDKGGNPKSSLTKEIIDLLIQQYEYETGREAICNCDRISQEYVGDIYSFIIALTPILEKFNINLGKDLSIGKYISQTLTKRKKRRSQYLTVLQLILNNPQFFLFHREVIENLLRKFFYEISQLSPSFKAQ